MWQMGPGGWVIADRTVLIQSGNFRMVTEEEPAEWGTLGNKDFTSALRKGSCLYFEEWTASLSPAPHRPPCFNLPIAWIHEDSRPGRLCQFICPHDHIELFASGNYQMVTPVLLVNNSYKNLPSASAAIQIQVYRFATLELYRLLSSMCAFYGWGNWGPELLNEVSKITQLTPDRVKMRIQGA